MVSSQDSHQPVLASLQDCHLPLCGPNMVQLPFHILLRDPHPSHQWEAKHEARLPQAHGYGSQGLRGEDLGELGHNAYSPGQLGQQTHKILNNSLVPWLF